MRTTKWNEKTVLEEIQNMANEDTDGVAYSSKAKAGMRFAVYRIFGDWAKACRAAGVKSVVETEEELSQVCGRSDIIKTDLSGGIKVKYNASSLCFDCKWATGKGNCSWVKNFTMPKNAIYYEKKIKTNTDEWTWTPIVIQCPDFIKG